MLWYREFSASKHLLFGLFLTLLSDLTRSETDQQEFRVTADATPGGVPFRSEIIRSKAECGSVCIAHEECEAAAVTSIPGDPRHKSCELYDLSNAQSSISRFGTYMLRINAGPQCIAGFTMSAPDFHCYAFIGTVMTWDAANTHCGSLVSGGHLVGIQSAEEDGFVHGLGGGSTWVWIGGKRPAGGAVDELYWTVTSEDLRLSYSHWMINRPDNYAGIQDCLALNDVAGEWNDLTCTETHPFVCEYIP